MRLALDLTPTFGTPKGPAKSAWYFNTVDGTEIHWAQASFKCDNHLQRMSTTITKEMEATKEVVESDAKDDVGVNKSDRNEGENIQNSQNPQTIGSDENVKDNEDGDAEEEADRHVIITPKRRIRTSSCLR